MLQVRADVTMLAPSSAALRLPGALLVVMLAQSAIGVAAPQLYRDVTWIKATWLGNDWITLLVACPLLLLALSGGRPQAPRWQALRIGLVGYAVYNYAFYMLGAALNPLFLVYVIAFVLAIAALIATLMAVRAESIADSFSPRLPARTLGGYMVVVAGCLTVVWAGMWARHIFAGAALPAAPEVFRLVAALDLSFMVPALALGGVLLWRQHAWGYPVASLALIQASLYLLILAVNSVIAIARDLAPWPGELPIWGPLCLTTSVAASVFIAFTRPAIDARTAVR